MKKYLKYFFYIIILYSVYFFIKSPSYSSEVSFYTNYNESSSLSSLGVLGSLGGFASDDNSLKFSITNYLSSDKLLKQIVEKEYIIEGNRKNLVDYWGSKYNNIFSVNPIALLKNINRNFALIKNLSVEEKKLLFAKEKLLRSIKHSEDKRSSLHTVNVILRTKDPLLSKQIVNAIFESIIDYSTEVTSIKAIEKRDFINARLFEIKKDLENTEKEMQLFLEKNKSITSPSLTLQQERIQRNILLYTQL